MMISDDTDTIFDRWRPWENKFAILPRWINGRVVFGTYYERQKLVFPNMYHQRTTSIFDVLKSQ